MAEQMPETPLAVKVWGEWACFTRPEMKVERVSYPTMTPSAARGVLEAIFWKPEFTWQVEEIWTLKPVRYVSILRNEVNTRVSERTARNWAQRGGGFVAADDRSQRNTLALRDVAYVIRAQAVPHSGTAADVAKYRDQFRRRVARGQCYAVPYLGCREFAAHFAEPDGTERSALGDEGLGRMLHDLRYATDGSGRGEPVFFEANLTSGILRVLAFPEAPAAEVRS
jgi:CRISPR-associated protein Cas5d